MIVIHNEYVNEQQDLENKRIANQAEYIRSETALRPQLKVSAESLGISMARRPIKKLPATHYVASNGATYGIDPHSGKKRKFPLLYQNPISSLCEVQDTLVFLPNSKRVDFRPSLENIILRGMLLGFGERHYYTVFKLYIQQYFCQYITVLTGLNASDIFDNLITIFKSHDVASLLKDDLRKFCRQNTQ